MIRAKLAAISWWKSSPRTYAICDACSHRRIGRGGGYMSGSWIVCGRCWWFKWHYGGRSSCTLNSCRALSSFSEPPSRPSNSLCRIESPDSYTCQLYWVPGPQYRICWTGERGGRLPGGSSWLAVSDQVRICAFVSSGKLLVFRHLTHQASTSPLVNGI